jgi:hypothetical protein
MVDQVEISDEPIVSPPNGLLRCVQRGPLVYQEESGEDESSHYSIELDDGKHQYGRSSDRCSPLRQKEGNVVTCRLEKTFVVDSQSIPIMEGVDCSKKLCKPCKLERVEINRRMAMIETETHDGV